MWWEILSSVRIFNTSTHCSSNKELPTCYASSMYVWITGTILFVVALILLMVFTDALRLLKVGYLVVVATPYEQVGEGEGQILVLGDSTAYGTGAKDNTKTIAGRFGADFPGYAVTNKGVNGWTTGDLAQYLESTDELADRYDLVVIQIGGNDTLQKRELAAVETDIKRVYTAVNELAGEVVMISSGNVGAAEAYVKDGQPDPVLEHQTRGVREIFMRVAPEYGVEYVDLFMEPADDVYLQDPKKYLAFDGLHPNEAGYGFWYESLGPVVREVLATSR